MYRHDAESILIQIFKMFRTYRYFEVQLTHHSLSYCLKIINQDRGNEIFHFNNQKNELLGTYLYLVTIQNRLLANSVHLILYRFSLKVMCEYYKIINKSTN